MSFNDLIDREYKNIIKKANKLSLSMDITEKDIEFMDEFGFTKEELKELKKLLKDNFYHYKETVHDYNNGDWTYDEREDEYHKNKRYEIGKKIRLICNKHIILSKINEISPEDISEKLLDTLQEIGYDGNSGSTVLKMCYNLRNNNSELSKHIERNKSTTSDIRHSYNKNQPYLEQLTARDQNYQRCINDQNKQMQSIRFGADHVTENIDTLKKDISISTFERFRRFFTGKNDDKYKKIESDFKSINSFMHTIKDNCRQAINNSQRVMNERYEINQVYSEHLENEEGSLYDRIKSPLESDANLLNMLKIYASLKDKNQLNMMYDTIVASTDQISSDDVVKYNDNFAKFIVVPAFKEIEKQVKDGTYILRQNDGYKPSYSLNEFKQVFSERSVEDIVEKGKLIEKLNPEVFSQINNLYHSDSAKNVDRLALYYKFLKSNNINLTDADFIDWSDYRVLLEESITPGIMGFHHNGERLTDENMMKLYLNAGTDSYELAQTFLEKCKKIGINPQFKVVVGNERYEIDRDDKVCIYAENIEQAKKYISVLEDIKKNRPDFDFKKPIFTAGTIDNWIGVGSDREIGTSYNNDISNILTNVFNNYFNRMGSNEIMQTVHNNPQLLQSLRKEIERQASQKGLSSDKICIPNKYERLFSDAKIPEYNDLVNKQRAKFLKSFEKIRNKPSNYNTIDVQTLQKLKEQGYDGKSGPEILQYSYKLFSKNEELKEEGKLSDHSLRRLKEKNDNQNNKIYALETRAQFLQNCIRNGVKKLNAMSETLNSTVQTQIDDVKSTVSFLYRGLKDRVKGIFNTRTKMLPGRSIENMDSELDTLNFNVNSIMKSCEAAIGYNNENTPLNVEDLIAEREKATARNNRERNENMFQISYE